VKSQMFLFFDSIQKCNELIVNNDLKPIQFSTSTKEIKDYIESCLKKFE